MGSPFRSSSFGSSSGFLTLGVKWLLIANTAIFLIQFALFHGLGVGLNFLKLTPEQTVHGFLWQPLTYMFLHSATDVSHVLWNMVSLFLMGPMLEGSWGRTTFLKYYVYSGVGAGVCVVIASYVMGGRDLPTVGASGALFGLLIAYGVLYPDVLFFGVIKAKWFALIWGAVQFLNLIAARSSGVSFIAHLGGMLAGYLLIRFGFLGRRRGPEIDPFAMANNWYREWKLARAKRKFEVYMRKQGRN
jgi:membrane associated rhomboid family serine protease